MVLPLPDNQFHNVCRWVLRGSWNHAQTIHAICAEVLQRFTVDPVRTPGPGGLPAPSDGSDQVDIRSFLEWTEKITVENGVDAAQEPCIRQILFLEHLATLRLGM